MFKIALCQTKVFINKDKNIENAVMKIREAASKGAKIISLPEMFNCPYSGENFLTYGEDETDSNTLKALMKVCKDEKIYLIAGTIPELYMGKVYNTSYIIGPRGEILSKYRKIHLFDVDIEGGTKFCESKYISKGSNITVLETEYCKIGVCICYDIRFPELIGRMALMDVKLIFAPAAFSSSTGPDHWELLLKARALDNQLYMAGISPSRDCEGSYKPYANSLVVSPWGDIIVKAGEAEEIIYADIDLTYINKVRGELPVLKHRRPEIY
jgi:omega-amidase